MCGCGIVSFNQSHYPKPMVSFSIGLDSTQLYPLNFTQCAKNRYTSL